jgi:hypothetical protein
LDPFAPIHGISLERYAELASEVSEISDPAKQAEVAVRLGVPAADWDAAKAGWTARMQDMSLMGQVASRFMPLYQAALARKSPAPQVSYEDYVGICACPPVIGVEAMLAHYKLSMAQWTQIAAQWNQVIATNPRYMQHGMLVEQESTRPRAGGAPRALGGSASAIPVAPAPTNAVSGAMPGAVPPPAYPYPAQAGYPPQAGYSPYYAPGYNQQAAAFGNEVGNAFNAFGTALGSFVNSAMGAYAVGARVLVQWSDGRSYPATVVGAQAGQVHVAFPDGRRVWVPQHYVTPQSPVF